MKNTESRTKEILNWPGEVADHAPLFENMAMFRDTVERLLSVLRAGNWREVHTGRRCMRLEVTYDYAAWERLMEQVEAALAQQPAAEPQPVAWQFQDRDGRWHGFLNEQHRLNTIEDGSWPIRALYTRPPPSAPEAKPAHYNRKRIARELERTAMGGRALRQRPACGQRFPGSHDMRAITVGPMGYRQTARIDRPH